MLLNYVKWEEEKNNIQTSLGYHGETHSVRYDITPTLVHSIAYICCASSATFHGFENYIYILYDLYHYLCNNSMNGWLQL